LTPFQGSPIIERDIQADTSTRLRRGRTPRGPTAARYAGFAVSPPVGPGPGAAGGRGGVARARGGGGDHSCVLLSDLVAASAAVAGTSARSAKIEQIAALLSRVPRGEVKVAVAFLSGEIPQGQIGVGYAALSGLLRFGPAGGDEPAVTEA